MQPGSAFTPPSRQTRVLGIVIHTASPARQVSLRGVIVSWLVVSRLDERELRTLPRASSAPSNNMITPSIINSAPNDVNPTCMNVCSHESAAIPSKRAFKACRGRGEVTDPDL